MGVLSSGMSVTFILDVESGGLERFFYGCSERILDCTKSEGNVKYFEHYIIVVWYLL